MTEQQAKTRAPKGPRSFCVPRAAIEALLDARADAYTICAYLTLASHTDESGMYSPASAKAVSVKTGANKMSGGPVPLAMQRLKEIRASRIEQVSNGKAGKSHAMVEQKIDLGPILFDRETWGQQTGEILPDGPTERGKIRHVLPTFGEALKDRVWFGSGLVEGHGEHKRPLKDLKDAGDIAARLLLAMYAACDMETWGGVRPVGQIRGPWKRYEPVADNVNLSAGAVLIRAKDAGTVASINPRVSGGDTEAYWRALEALESAGLFYEVVLVLNRNATPAKFASEGGKEGRAYGQIPDDAEPLYELDCRSLHGPKPKGEEGLGGITARTAGDFNQAVAQPGGIFDGTYAAIVKRGQGAMIAGIYRPRYRVSNPKNAGVKDAWARIHEKNRDYYAFLSSLRSAKGLPAMPAPWAKEAENHMATTTGQGLEDDVGF